MTWTHIYDLFLKLAVLFVVIFSLMIIPGFDDANGAVVIGAVMIGWLGLYHFVGRTISTYLYSRFTLGMKLSLDQARQLNDAFTPPIFRRQWLPMKDIRALDEAIRYPTALARTQDWMAQRSAERKQQFDEFHSSPLWHKGAMVLLVLSMAYLFFACILELPPADSVIQWYCSTFDTDRYSPMLIWLAMLIPLMLVYALIRKVFWRNAP
jgi:hypothetical protein